MYEDAPILAFNAVAFILAIALANNAFRDHSTLEEILAIRPPVGEATVAIDWSWEKRNEPVFKDGDGKIEKSSAFGHNLAEVGHRAGYEQNITVRDARREVLTLVDCGFQSLKK